MTDHRTHHPTMEPDQPIAWRAVRADTRVRSADGATVGTLADLLGADQQDIFHGIVVRLHDGGREVFVPADDVSLMTPTYLDVAYTAEELRGLPEHTEARQAELGWLGRFRRGMGIGGPSRR